MTWIESLDVALFRFINLMLWNPVFDRVMPFLSNNKYFLPALPVVAALVIWKWRRRGVLCVFFLMAVVFLGDPLVVNTIKKAVARPRPFNALADVNVPVGVGKTDTFAMPSSHASTWFAMTLVAFVYFRRSVRVMLPLACAVGFSRVYNGVHYPSDVLAGAAIGAGNAAVLLWGCEALWRRSGRRWFPLWWEKLPSLTNPDLPVESAVAVFNRLPVVPQASSIDQHWRRLAYVIIAALFLFRLAYIASGRIELSEDEAYQWLWSKNLALSYYSKPPLIAFTQFAGTSIWGDRELGVRFFSPLIAATLSVLLFRFFAREVNVRAAFWLVVIASTTPLMAVGATLMTIDPLSVLFWSAAMISGWRAVQLDSMKQWLWTGLWMGLGFLSKYTALFQWLCWAVFFVLWKPARVQLRRPGPYLAVLINAFCTLPVLVWNAQHDWITVTHVAGRGGLHQAWNPTLRFVGDFIGAEFGLLNPVYFIAAVWAAIAIWRRGRKTPLIVYLFSMGAPLFLFYSFYTLRARVLPNWIAPAVLPLLSLMVVYWEDRWREGVRLLKGWLKAGVGLGLVAVVLLHETNLIGKIAGRQLPPEIDPLRRVRGWKDTAKVVGEARSRLLAEGKPVFIIGAHYGIASQVAFYLPEARSGVPDHPLVYCRSSDQPENQFYFWPGYRDRKGESAIYVQETREPGPPPERIEKEFASVTDLGIHKVYYRGRVFRQLQLFECRNLH